MGDNETSFRDYASRLQNKVFEIKTIIDSKSATVAKKKGSSSNGFLAKSALFKLLTGMVFLRSLKKDRELYNHVISRIDDCLDVSEIANIAEAFCERKQTDDPLLTNVATVNHVKGGYNVKSSKPCFFNFEGRCKKGADCRFAHGQFSQEEVNAHGYADWKRRAGQNETDEKSGNNFGQVSFVHGPGTLRF